MSQANNLAKLANNVTSSGLLDVTTGITGTFNTANLPTIPINKGGTNLTSVGSNGTILVSNGTNALFGSAGGAIAWQAVQSSNFTATAGCGYLVNTTTAQITVTLPSSPSLGQQVTIVDYAGTADINNIIIDPNGSNINGSSNIAYIKTKDEGLTLVYIDSTQGWLSQSSVYASGDPFIRPYTASYVLVAGGGAGGNTDAGGGGAGGFISGTTSLIPGTVYTVTIGGGGTAGPTSTSRGGSGTPSSFTGLTTAIGGGGGGAGTTGTHTGIPGGSGGGAGYLSGSAQTGGTGTPGQGNNGGNSPGSPLSTASGGGGGGASAAGAAGQPIGTGNGGTGTATSLTGSPTFYADGGGGGHGGTPTTGGSGTGGGGQNLGNGTNATANRGSGGGGGGGNNGTGGNGSGGIFIMSVPTANYSGVLTGTYTTGTNGSNTWVRWTVSGSYTA